MFDSNPICKTPLGREREMLSPWATGSSNTTVALPFHGLLPNSCRTPDFQVAAKVRGFITDLEVDEPRAGCSSRLCDGAHIEFGCGTE
jgi:hypothetical protein